MSSLLKIETPLLDKDIAVIEEQIGILRNSISEMRNAESSLSTMWEGEAKEAFRIQFDKDCEMMENIVSFLNGYKEALTAANKEYLLSSDSVSSIIQSISI